MEHFIDINDIPAKFENSWENKGVPADFDGAEKEFMAQLVNRKSIMVSIGCLIIYRLPKHSASSI